MIERIISGSYLFYNLATGLAGVVKGFCDETGIEVSNNIFFAIPTIHAVMGIIDGVSIAKNGRQVTGNYPNVIEKQFTSYVGQAGEKYRSLLAGYVGGFGEGLAGTLYMGIGYAIGRYFGHMSKLH